MGLDVPPEFLTDASPARYWRPHQAEGRLWVAEAQGVRLGFLAAQADGARLHVEQLQVLRAHQGRGIGRQLLATAIDWARARGFSTVSLTTFRSVAWNAPFYASAGFREVARHEMAPGLRATAEHEAALGWPDRCAMVLDL
ncbi:MAG: GNAT family N-acetyltransferase [Caulobacterales bacterium]|nr:GNAT family N-acetyltransferase [Caulobacterales bacterium]